MGLRWLVVVLMIGFAGACVIAQDSFPQATFKSEGNLVLVPTIVTQHGAAVTDLDLKNFTILLDGKPQQISVFEPVHAVPARVKSVSPEPNTVSNFASADNQQEVVIVALDFINAGFTSLNKTRDYLSKMAQQFTDAHTPVTLLLLTDKGLHQVYSFTNAPSDLQKAIDQWGGHAHHFRAEPLPDMNWSSAIAPVTSERSVWELSQAARTAQAGFSLRATEDLAITKAEQLEQIAHAFAGIPGRKKMIWISTGFPLLGEQQDDNQPQPADYVSEQFRVNAALQRAWTALSTANIAVYPIDSNGVVLAGWDTTFGPSVGFRDHFGSTISGRGGPPSRSHEVGTNTASLLQVAAQTGGLACTLPPKECVARDLIDAKDYYLLGFYLHGTPKPGWHKLKVSTDREGVSIRARQGLQLGEAEKSAPAFNGYDVTINHVSKPLSSDALDMVNALYSPLDYTAVPLTLRWTSTRLPSRDEQLDLMLTSPANGIAVSSSDHRTDVDLLAFARPVGKTTGQTFPQSWTAELSPEQQKLIAAEGFRFHKQISLAPGRYELRMFLRDNISRQIGTVSTLIDLSH